MSKNKTTSCEQEVIKTQMMKKNVSYETLQIY